MVRPPEVHLLIRRNRFLRSRFSSRTMRHRDTELTVTLSSSHTGIVPQTKAISVSAKSRSKANTPAGDTSNANWALRRRERIRAETSPGSKNAQQGSSNPPDTRQRQSGRRDNYQQGPGGYNQQRGGFATTGNYGWTGQPEDSAQGDETNDANIAQGEDQENGEIDGYHADESQGSGETDGYDETYDEGGLYNFTTVSPRTCRNCEAAFPSGTKLHKHLRLCRPKQSKVESSDSIAETQVRLKQAGENFSFTAAEVKQNELSAITLRLPGQSEDAALLKTWKYATFKARFTQDGDEHDCCADSGSTGCLVDDEFLKRVVKDAKRQNIPPEKLRGIGKEVHTCNETASFFIEVRSESGRRIKMEIVAKITKHLKANLLFGIDAIGVYQIDLLLSSAKMKINAWWRRDCQD